MHTPSPTTWRLTSTRTSTKPQPPIKPYLRCHILAPALKALAGALGQRPPQALGHLLEQVAAHAPGLEGGCLQGPLAVPGQPGSDGQGVCQSPLLALEGCPLQAHLLRQASGSLPCFDVV